MLILRTLAVASAFFAAATCADAAVYTSRADWEAAVPTHVDETIPNVGPFAFVGVGNASITYGTLTYVQQASIDPGAGLFNIGPAFSGQDPILTSSSAGVANIRIDLPGFFKAIAFDFGTQSADVTVKIAKLPAFTLAAPDDDLYSTRGFFGIVDDAGFNQVLITAGGTLAVRNVSYGAETASVPEPAAWALMLLGFGSLGAALRSRRRAATLQGIG